MWAPIFTIGSLCLVRVTCRNSFEFRLDSKEAVRPVCELILISGVYSTAYNASSKASCSAHFFFVSTYFHSTHARKTLGSFTQTKVFTTLLSDGSSVYPVSE